MKRGIARRHALGLLGGAFVGLALPHGAASGAEEEPAPRRDFAVYYGAEDGPTLADFDLLVLDSDTHPALGTIIAAASRRPTILGYLSLAEVGSQRPYAEWLRRHNLLLGENPDWPGSLYIDLRRRIWHRHVVGVLVPRILAAGFDGVFLDTLDDAEEHERKDRKRFKGMKASATDLVREIRSGFPGTVLMMNRGFALLPKLGGTVDAVLGESLLAAYDFASDRHGWAPDDAYAGAVALLQGERRKHPALRVYTLDYWDPADTASIARIYATQRANGFVPYVATIGLDKIVAEPQA